MKTKKQNNKLVTIQQHKKQTSAQIARARILAEFNREQTKKIVPLYKKAIVISSLAIVTYSVTGCMMVAATPSGLREFHRGQNGLVVTGKSQPNVQDEYHKTQQGFDSIKAKLQEMKNDIGS